MIFAGIKLPRRLQRHVANLSSTVQVLLSEIVLAVEGYGDPEMRKADTEFKWADLKGKKDATKINAQLQQYVDYNKLKPEDAAIASAALAGRSTAEVAEFFGINQMYAMRRLCSLRKQADKFKPIVRRERIRSMVQLCFRFVMDPEADDAEVLEEFAEAARR